MAQALRIPESFPTPCRVCGCRQVQIDAVEGSHPEAPLLLAECPRCDHRWTDAWTPRIGAPPRPARRALREVASAA